MSRFLPATRFDIEQMEQRIMDKLNQCLADVADESTMIDSVGTLLSGMRKQLDDALSGATLPPATLAKVVEETSPADATV